MCWSSLFLLESLPRCDHAVGTPQMVSGSMNQEEDSFQSKELRWVTSGFRRSVKPQEDRSQRRVQKCLENCKDKLW